MRLNGLRLSKNGLGVSDRGADSRADIIPALKPSSRFHELGGFRVSRTNVHVTSEQQCDKRAASQNRIASFHTTHHQPL